ncbi:MAG: HAMP domain-containing protein [Oceanospirillaceae bacterium]|nr:HAMP domain-containing protein [Oceanospirillaceae bacterium]
MTAYFLVVSMTAVIALAAVSYLLSASRLEAMAISRFEVIAAYKQQEIDALIARQIETVTQIAAREELRQAGTSLLAQEIGTLDYQSAFLKFSNAVFNATYRGSSAVTASDLIDIQVFELASGRVFFDTSPDLDNKAFRNWAELRPRLLDTEVMPVYRSEDTGRPTLTILAPLLDLEGERYGLLAADIRVPIMVEIVSRRAGLGDTGQSYLVDGEHRLVAPPAFTRIDEQDKAHSPGIDAAVTGAKGAALYRNHHGEPVIGSYRWLPGPGLALLTEISVSEALTPATRLGWSILGFGMIAVLLLAAGSYLIARQIARPILAITATAHRIAQGDLQQRAPLLANDETGNLANNFNEMVDRLRETLALLSDEKHKSERLLLNILPEPIAERLKHGESTIADSFGDVSIMFADLVNFTPLASQLPPKQLVGLLNEIFTEFDSLCEAWGLEKIKTIGDAYLVVAGLPNERKDHARLAADMALDMLATIERFNRRHDLDLMLRIGIHSGPVVAGVIGTKKFNYDIWGDAVNIASRMESHGITSRIQVSEQTHAYLQDAYEFDDRGLISIRGKGEMRTWLLRGKKADARSG